MRQIKAIEKANRERLLEVNPDLTDESGIYFLTRVQPEGYIGQAKHICQRLCQHLSGYDQYVDRSLKAHGLYSEDNPYGYKVNFLPFPESKLDEMEQYYIQKYLENGYRLKNKTAGSQGVGKVKIADFKPAKGYHDGIKAGRRSIARELSSIIIVVIAGKSTGSRRSNNAEIRKTEKYMQKILCSRQEWIRPLQ